jgi:hypothetical protein
VQKKAFILSISIALVALLQCKTTPSHTDIDENDSLSEADHNHPILERETSIFDSISRPHLLMDDTASFIMKASALLAFTNQLEWDGGVCYFRMDIVIDKNGAATYGSPRSTPEIEAQMIKFCEGIKPFVSDWQPAALKYGSREKVAFEAEIIVYIYEHDINFRIKDAENFPFFYKRIKRPILSP